MDSSRDPILPDIPLDSSESDQVVQNDSLALVDGLLHELILEVMNKAETSLRPERRTSNEDESSDEVNAIFINVESVKKTQLGGKEQ